MYDVVSRLRQNGGNVARGTRRGGATGCWDLTAGVSSGSWKPASLVALSSRTSSSSASAVFALKAVRLEVQACWGRVAVSTAPLLLLI